MRRIAVLFATFAVIASSCATSTDLDTAPAIGTAQGDAPLLLDTTTTQVEPATRQTGDVSAEATTSTVAVADAETTDVVATTEVAVTTTEADLLPAPDPVTDAPPGAAEWGDIVVSIESYWTEVFVDFAGTGTYRPLDRDRIVGVDDSDRSIPDCDATGITARSVEQNAFAVTCGEGQLILWDNDDLFVELLQDFDRTGPAIVLAHELGHAAQSQAGVLRRTGSVIIEQQADCLAGAYASWANERGIAPFDTPEALDAAVGATVSFRDQPGSSANSARAHGSGFDRVRAFQDGFDRGAEFCATYPATPPPITEFPFRSAADARTGGNLPFDELIDLVLPYFNEYFGAQTVGWTDLTPSAADLRTWRVDHDRVGDNATGTRLALLFAAETQRLLGLETTGDVSALQQACLAGSSFGPLFFPQDTEDEYPSLSPGDLDEAVVTLTRIVEDSTDFAAGFLFDYVAALRVGFTDGIGACGLA